MSHFNAVFSFAKPWPCLTALLCEKGVSDKKMTSLHGIESSFGRNLL